MEPWKTPVMDVGTDSAEYSILHWAEKNTGVLDGAEIPFGPSLKSEDTALNVLVVSVLGSILQNGVLTNQPAMSLLKSLTGAFNQPAKDAAPPPAYEARVLEGIWAAAPYLHNGSVRTLAELLKKPADRVRSFKIGPAYDPVNVGLAKDEEQTKFDYELETTDCSDRKSGNSRCGHAGPEYGTELSDEDKKDLLEYLKTL
jgi:hypothetical protein